MTCVSLSNLRYTCEHFALSPESSQSKAKKYECARYALCLAEAVRRMFEECSKNEVWRPDAVKRPMWNSQGSANSSGAKFPVLKLSRSATKHLYNSGESHCADQPFMRTKGSDREQHDTWLSPGLENKGLRRRRSGEIHRD